MPVLLFDRRNAMTKNLDGVRLMGWLIGSCIGTVAIMFTAYMVLMIFLRIRELLEGPCG